MAFPIVCVFNGYVELYEGIDAYGNFFLDGFSEPIVHSLGSRSDPICQERGAPLVLQFVPREDFAIV